VETNDLFKHNYKVIRDCATMILQFEDKYYEYMEEYDAPFLDGEKLEKGIRELAKKLSEKGVKLSSDCYADLEIFEEICAIVHDSLYYPTPEELEKYEKDF